MSVSSYSILLEKRLVYFYVPQTIIGYNSHDQPLIFYIFTSLKVGITTKLFNNYHIFQEFNTFTQIFYKYTAPLLALINEIC